MSWRTTYIVSITIGVTETCMLLGHGLEGIGNYGSCPGMGRKETEA